MVAEWERDDAPPLTTESTADAIRVLCVDDDSSFCDLAALQLERVTADADRPVSVVTETDPSDVPSSLPDVDCVVSDDDMPDVDGLELLETVREYDADVPFILFTGRGSEGIASRAISAGVTDYIRKGGQSDRFVMLANRIEEAVARYEAERELERSTDRLRRVVDQLPQCVFVKDAVGRYLLINEPGAASYGRTPAEVEGKHEAELLDDDTAARFNAEDRRVTESGETIEITAQRTVDAGGEEAIERVRKVPFDFVADEGAVLGVATDVTTEHRIADRCADLHDTLDAADAALDETMAAHERGDGAAVAAGHERLAALRDAVPTDELDRLLGGSHGASDDETVR
jgi:PAS domain S-box-containing protein